MKRSTANSTPLLIVAALSLVIFPLLVVVAFSASRKLLPSLTNFQFNPIWRPGNFTGPEANVRLPQTRGTLPPFLNFSFPNFPSITYSDILIIVAILVISLAFIQALRIKMNRMGSAEPLSGMDEPFAERNKVAAILDEAVRKLDLGWDYRDTVLQCYKLIAQTLEAKSEINGRTLTASEFNGVVSKKLKFSSHYLSRVTALFEVARYSKQEITQENASEAKECLSELSAELKEKNALLQQ